MEASVGPHLVDGYLHRVSTCQWQRFGYIADAEADERSIRVGFTEAFDPPGDFGE